MTFISAGFAYAVAVFAFGFALGTVRVLLLVPRLGATKSVLLEAPVILAISWIVSKVIVQRFHVRPEPVALGAMGGAAFGVLICLEFAVSVFIFGKAASAFFPEYGTPAGAIGLAAQIGFALFPLVQACRPTQAVGKRIRQG